VVVAPSQLNRRHLSHFGHYYFVLCYLQELGVQGLQAPLTFQGQLVHLPRQARQILLSLSQLSVLTYRL
jgi:hypothetical protein